MFVSAALSIVAQTVLAAIHQEPAADLIDEEIRRESGGAFEEPGSSAEAWLGDSKMWEIQAKQNRIPWKDYLGSFLGGILALSGPVLCTLSSKREWCVVDPDLSSMVSWVHVEETALSMTILSVILKGWRTRRVRRLVIEQEKKFIESCSSGIRAWGGGSLYRDLRVQYDFLGENHRLAFIGPVLKAFDGVTLSGNYRR